MDHTFVVLAYKESKYLETCIKSVLNQKYESNVIIATSTPNDYISRIANKYNLELIINQNSGQGIGFDFDFALSCAKSKLVTIAHQDDYYDYLYSNVIMQASTKYPDATLLFSDYYEIKNENKIYSNLNLRIKRILLSLLKIKRISKFRIIKRSCIAFGNSICCPAVTFNKMNINFSDIFNCDFKCDVDWYAWEKISKLNGRFVFINECLMGHRVHEESTTTKIISENTRTIEDLEMFKKFWPNSIAMMLNNLYSMSEQNNKVKEE